MSKRTVLLDPYINIGILHLTTCYQSSDKQCQAIEAMLAKHAVIHSNDAGLPLDDDNDEVSSPSPPRWLPEDPEPLLATQDQQQIVFDQQGPDNQAHGQVDINKGDNVDEPVASKMLENHHRMAHLPFSGCRLWHVQDNYHMSLPLATSPSVLPSSMAKLHTAPSGLKGHMPKVHSSVLPMRDSVWL